MEDEVEEPKVYYPENAFIELFGGETKTIMKLADTLLSHPTKGYTKKDLAEVNDISEQTVLKNWSMLTKHEIIEKKDEKYGKTRWKLNQGSEIVKHLYKLSVAVHDYRTENGLTEAQPLKEE